MTYLRDMQLKFYFSLLFFCDFQILYYQYILFYNPKRTMWSRDDKTLLLSLKSWKILLIYYRKISIIFKTENYKALLSISKRHTVPSLLHEVLLFSWMVLRLHMLYHPHLQTLWRLGHGQGQTEIRAYTEAQAWSDLASLVHS